MDASTTGGLSPSDLAVPHTVQVHPQSGSLGVSVPIELTSGRGGFGPQLSLDYRSGGGNGGYGRGWSLSGLLSVSVDTSHGLARYDGADNFVLAGAGELVPHAEAAGDLWEDRGAFRVRRYRARFERGFLRIECWHEKAGGRMHWRVRDARDTLTVFGERADGSSRIADPAQPQRVHSWLPDFQVDAHGNAIVYHYAPETFQGVDPGRPEESARVRSGIAPAWRYLKRIEWGNLEPLAADDLAPAGQRWCFQLVFDYGDHDADDPAPTPDRAWPVRPDAFSSYGTGFELRQYRLCRRLLLFHHFPELAAAPVRVHSYVLDHELRPEGSLLARVLRTGHRLDAGQASSKQRPPLVFEYTRPQPGQAFLAAPATTLDHVQHGLDGPRYRLIDLYGEGLPGILVEQPEAWMYKPNLGGGRFGRERQVVEKPSHSIASISVQDFDGDGNTDLVVHGARGAGYYEFDRRSETWRGFVPFASVPHLDAMLSGTHMLDVDGDGLSDLVLASPERLTWYPSRGKQGYGEGRSVQAQDTQPAHAPTAPWRESAQLAYFFADMSGDGLQDQVLVRDGAVVYWPNLGHGRFGAPVTMDGAPRFGEGGSFDTGRLLFADLDGSGTADLVYVGHGEVTLWTNAGGNALLPGRTIRGLPRIDRNATLRVLDFLGDGTACLVWSQTTGSGAASLQYLPLTGGVRPGLMASVANSMGAQRRVAYGTSATHYLRDAAAGRPWRRKLPRHVTVVETIELADLIGGARSLMRYRYHDGSYDGRERQFRGFGFVEAFDADADAAEPADAGTTAPACTRSWFHLGADGVSSRELMWAGDPTAAVVAPHLFEQPDALTQAEAEDALMALAGRPVRQELFAVLPDGALADAPFEVEDVGYLVRRLQPALRRHRASFAVFEREKLSSTYEQAAFDPRIVHRLTLEIDAFGAGTVMCDVAYGRRLAIPADDPAQRRTDVTVNRLRLDHVDTPQRVALATLVEAAEFDLGGLEPAPGQVFQWRALKAQVAAALAAPVDFDAPPAAPGTARRLGWSRHFYWNADGSAVLPLGQHAAPVRMHHMESAAYTPQLVASLYDAKVDAAKLQAAGYRLDAGHWWRMGEVFVHGSRAVFFRLQEIHRPDGGATVFGYDAASMKPLTTTDAAGNQVQAEIDYHLLAPRRTVDENGCVTEVLRDPLGVAIATTEHGQVPQGGGSAPYGFEAIAGFALPPAATPESAIADPDGHVQHAASVLVYDLERFAAEGKPPMAVSLARGNLRHDGSGVPLPPGDVAVMLSYYDGFGRALQTKLKVEPGEAVKRGAGGAIELGDDGRPLMAHAAARWLVQGHAVYDRKQQPVLRYEPFFSGRPGFEDEAELRRFGSFHSFVYDALGRPVRHDEPNGTFSRAEHTPWLQRNFDANDTVEDSLYRIARQGLPAGAAERRAYENAKAHHGTPVQTHLDPMGRAVLVTESDGQGNQRRTASRYGPDGELVQVTDPRGLVALTQVHDMLGRVARSRSLDSGEELLLHDGFGRPVNAWTARGMHVERGFDRMDRLLWVDISGSLDGSPIARRRVQAIVYGDEAAVPDGQARNLRGRAAVIRDEAGERTIELCAPTGTVLSSAQRLVADVTAAPDWSVPADVVLMAETFRTRNAADGDGRIVRQELPDGSTQLLRYARIGGLDELRLSSDDGLLDDQVMFSGARFNARGQRTALRLGNGAEMASDFDATTWRMRRLQVRRTAGPKPGLLMDMAYTYDPVGNIVAALDGAQQPDAPLPVLSGLGVSAEKIFGYDGFYQLVRAQGRVHKALLPDDHRTDAPNPGTVKGTRAVSLNDAGQIERYTQTYAYDLSGNMTRLTHTGTASNWTTDFWVSPTGNRSLPALDAGGLPVAAPQTHFDAAGNSLRLPHLRAVQWTYHNYLRRAVIIDRSGSGKPDDDEWYVTDAEGRRVRKQTRRLLGGGLVETTDVLYLDGCEIKRIRRDGDLTLERKLTHVGDGLNRVALAYRWTRDDAARETDDLAAPKVRYQLNDHLGSAQLALDENADVISYEDHLPFGGTAFMAGDDAREVALRSYRFCGKERDDATGLYHFGHRYYAAWMCRWINPDPAGFVDGLNRYIYVHNNPVTYFDPDGLDSGQKRGKEKVVVGARPLVVDEAWAALPKERQEELRKLMADKNFSWFLDSSNTVHFGTRAEIRTLAEAKLQAGENVGELHAAPDGAKPGDPTGKGGAGSAKKPPKKALRKPPGDGAGGGATAGGGKKGSKKPGSGDQGQDGSKGGAKGPGDKPGDSSGKGDSKDPGGQSANPGDGGGDGAPPGSGGLGGPGHGKGEKGDGPGGGGTGDELGSGEGLTPGEGKGAGLGSGKGEGDGDKDEGKGTGEGDHGPGAHGKGDHPGGDPAGKGKTPGGSGHGKEPGGTGKTPGGKGKTPGGQDGGVPNGAPAGQRGAAPGGTGTDPAGQPNGNANTANGQSTTGDPNGQRNDGQQGAGGGKPPDPNANGQGSPQARPGGQGQPGGKPGENKGGPPGGGGGPPQDKTVMDHVVTGAGYWNLEFGANANGASGGVPGGFGTHNWGSWGQAIFVTLVAADIIITFLSLGGTAAIKAGLKAGWIGAKAALTGAVQLGKKGLERVATKASTFWATHSMEIAVGKGAIKAFPVHAAWKAGGRWLHAAGSKPLYAAQQLVGAFRKATASGKGLGEAFSIAWKKEGPRLTQLQKVSAKGASEFAGESLTFRLPSLFPQLAPAAEGRAVLSCVTSTWNAWSRTNLHLPNMLVAGGAGYGVWRLFGGSSGETPQPKEGTGNAGAR
ncbi:MAG: SpvB/TcaC N-terminal domain-containing protein [Pseudomonadota bacterium]